MKKIKLKLQDICIDGGTQARVKMDPKHIEHLSELLKDKVNLGPLIVYGEKNWLVDGYHRYFAHKANGNLEVEVEWYEGTQEEAILESFTVNGKRGLPMTKLDNDSMVTRMLEHPLSKDWSNGKIAKHIGVSTSTVGRIIDRLAKNNKIEKSTKKQYIDKHGNKSEMDVSKIGKTKKKDLPKAPEVEPPDDLVRELTDTITSLSEENTLLKDKIAIEQWDATEIEKIDAEETIKNLREQIRLLEIENKSLKESRDMQMNRNAELTRTVKSLQAKLKKLEK